MKIFLDSSVVVAGIVSPKGGSGAILELIGKKKLSGYISKMVLKEVRRNIVAKFPKETFENYIKVLAKTPFVVFREPTVAETSKWLSIIERKDAHILASCKQSKVDYLVTLDKKHFKAMKVQQAVPFKIVTPGELLNLLTKSS